MRIAKYVQRAVLYRSPAMYCNYVFLFLNSCCLLMKSPGNKELEHSMQMVSSRDNLHEMSKHIF